MRLIDADALEREYREQFEAVYKGIRNVVNPYDYYIERKAAYDKALVKMEMESFCKFLQSRPTIEAEPVRHGRWIGGVYHNQCSLCGGFTRRKDIEPRYCPNCGAKMDGKKE